MRMRTRLREDENRVYRNEPQWEQRRIGLQSSPEHNCRQSHGIRLQEPVSGLENRSKFSGILTLLGGGRDGRFGA